MQGGWVIPKPLKWVDIIDKPPVLEDSIVEWSEIQNKPTTFTPNPHSHAIATTTVDGFLSAANLIKLNGIAVNANNYTHPTGDGNLHVPLTGTTNNTKVLKAGSTVGSLNWGFVDWGEINNKPATFAPTAHNQDAGTVTTGVFDSARIPILNQNTTGNALTATTLQTARTIALSGAATGTATNFNGSANITIPVTALNASNLSSGTVPNARITGSYTGLTNLTGSGNVDFSRFLGNAADTVSTPSFSWTGDTNTGIYQPAIDQLAITTGGIQRALFSSVGLTLPGNISASNISIANTASTIVQRDGSGDIKCRLVRGEYTPTSSGNFQHIIVTRTPGIDTDNYFRIATLAEFRAAVTDGVYLPIGAQAVNAALLDGIDSASFVRSDVSDTVNATTTWADNHQVRLGSGSDHRMFFDGSNTYKDNYAGSILYRNFTHGGYHYFQGEDAGGTNRALAYFGNGLAQLYGGGTENLRCDVNETVLYKNARLTNSGPLFKLEDSDTTHHSFWLHVNSNIFYVLSDRTNAGSWQAPHPLYLNNADNTGVLYGKKILAANQLVVTEPASQVIIQNTANTGSISIVVRDSTSSENTCATFTNTSSQLLFSSGTKLITTNTGVTVYGAVATSSDPKLKENVKPLTNSLEDVEQIEYNTFDWIESKIPGLGIKLSTLPEHLKPALMGESINPDTEEMTLNFNYSSFVAVVGQAVKELSEKVKQLEARILELEL